MMGIPPPSRDTSSSSRVSSDRDKEDRGKSDFNLRRKSRTALDEQKDEALQKLESSLKDIVSSLKDLSPEQKKEIEERIKAMKKEIEELKESGPESAAAILNTAKQLQAEAAELRETAAVHSSEAAAAVSKTAELIKKMASELLVGKDMASMRLKEAEVPSYLQGSTLVVQKVEGGVAITFHGLSPQQAREAKMQMEGNQALLDKLATDLQNKNIQVNSISLGGHETVALNAQPTAPISTVGTEQPQERREREGGGQGGREQGEGNEEKERR